MIITKTDLELKGISIILPAYNEEKNISKIIEEITDFIEVITHSYEIIVVNDGSSDNIAYVAENISKTVNNLKVINFEKNMGYGYALKIGFERAKYEYLFFTDSDRQFDISNLWYMLPYIKEYDIVVGYRVKRNDKFKRIFASWGYNILCKILFNLKIRDVDCAFKLFRKSVFEKIHIESNRFFVNTEILAKARILNYKIIEVPVLHFPRKVGYSTVTFSDIFRTLSELKRIYFSLKGLK